MEITDKSLFLAAMKEAAVADLEQTTEDCCEAIAELPLLQLRVNAAYEQMQAQGLKETEALQRIVELFSTGEVTGDKFSAECHNRCIVQAGTLAKLTILLAAHEAIGFEAGCKYGHTMALGEMSGAGLER
jgi:hypothetical protein